MNYFTSKTAEQLTLVSISHAREGKAGELKKACLDLIEKTRQEEGAIRSSRIFCHSFSVFPLFRL